MKRTVVKSSSAPTIHHTNTVKIKPRVASHQPPKRRSSHARGDEALQICQIYNIQAKQNRHAHEACARDDEQPELTPGNGGGEAEHTKLAGTTNAN